MELRPLPHETRGPGWKIAVEELTARDEIPRSMLPVQRMKVGRWMILRKHPDHDAIELANGGHSCPPSVARTVVANQMFEPDSVRPCGSSDELTHRR